MSLPLIGFLGLAVLLVLILLRVPVAPAMGLVGFVGYGYVNGWANALQVTGSVPFDVGSNYALSQLPLFLLMGDIAVRSGMSGRLYASARTIFTGIRGSEAYATIGASAGFGAICGSSLATAAMMTRVALPAMDKSGYDRLLSVGSVAAGGTLGILIPPSIALVVYAMIAEQSVPRLYAASLIPGILLSVLYCLVVLLMLLVNPKLAPADNRRVGLVERLKALADVWEIALLFTLVIGGIYTGLFTATEAAAVGAAGAWLLGTLSRSLTWQDTGCAILDTIRTTAILFVILFSANIFTYFVVLTSIPQEILKWINLIDLNGVALMVMLAAFYILLGTFMEAFGMLLITVPIFLPVVASYGYNPIWFGVFLVIIIEAGLISPPVGMNLFVIQDQVRDFPLMQLYKSVMPFIAAPIVLAGIIIAFPETVMWLPRVLFGGQ